MKIKVLLTLLVSFLSPKLFSQTAYPVKWTDNMGVTVNSDNSLTKNSAHGWGNAGAASKNHLSAGQDGWIEFKPDVNLSSSFTIGLSENNKDAYLTSIEHGFYYSSGKLFIYELGVQQGTTFGSLQTNDLLRIGRIGNEIKYYKNGVILKSTLTYSGKRLLADVSINATQSKAPPVYSSFDKQRLEVSASITHKKAIEGGQILLNVTGGSGIYTYEWENGLKESTRTNLEQGVYVVTVRDSNSDAVTTSFQIGNQIEWKEAVGTNVNTDNSITKNSSHGWGNAGAASRNVLMEDEDGWIEYKLTSGAINFNFYFGFSEHNLDAYPSSIAYAFSFANGKISIYERGVQAGADFGYLHIGDILGIGKVGNEIRYYKNGNVLKSTLIETVKPLIVDLSMHTTQTTVRPLYCSFSEKILEVTGSITHSTKFEGGKIEAKVSGGNEPYSYFWEDGGTSPTRINLNPGVYTLTITDANLNTKTERFQVGNKIDWTDLFGITLKGDNSLTKNSAHGWGNAGAASKNELSKDTDGWVEYRIPNGTINLSFSIGLSGMNKDANYTSIDYAFFYLSGKLSIVENGIPQGSDFGFLHINDVIRIARIGGEIKYYRNGNLLKTTPLLGKSYLIVDVAMANTQTHLAPIYCSFDSHALDVVEQIRHKSRSELGEIKLKISGGVPPYILSWEDESTDSVRTGLDEGSYTVTVKDSKEKIKTVNYQIGNKIEWSDLYGITLNTNNVPIKNSSHGWGNAGAVSRNELSAGENGWVEFKIISSNVSYNYYIGLSEKNENAYPETIDHAVAFSVGNLSFYEKGEKVGDFGFLHLGDILRISREGDEVKYAKNGVVLTSTKINPNIALIVDLSMGNTSTYLPDVYASFDKHSLKANATVIHKSNLSNGEILLSTSGGAWPYFYTWEDGSSNGNRVGLNNGLYTVSVKDAQKVALVESYRIGDKIDWKDPVGVRVNSDNSLTKTGPNGWGTGGAASLNTLNSDTDGWMEYRTNSLVNNTYIAGLSFQNTDASNTTIDYAFYFSTGRLWIYEKGVAQGNDWGFLHLNDILRIGRVGNEILYYKNGQIIKRSTTDRTRQLIVDVAIVNSSAKLPVMYCQFTPEVLSNYTFKSRTSGPWSDHNTWLVLEGSNYIDAPLGTIPGEGNTVYLQANHTIALNTHASCKDLHLNSTSDVVRLNTGENTLNVYGKIRSYTGTAPGINSTSAGVSNWISTGTNGRIRLKGTTNRTITEDDEFSDHENLKGWTLECDLAEGVIGTINSNFRVGNVIITSGNLEVKSKNFRVSK